VASLSVCLSDSFESSNPHFTVVALGEPPYRQRYCYCGAFRCKIFTYLLCFSAVL
jgi:hypothetical protein